MTVCGLFFYFLLLEIQMRKSCIKLASISIKKKRKKAKQAKPRKPQHHNKFSFSEFPHLEEAHEISRKDAVIFHPQWKIKNLSFELQNVWIITL